MQNLSVVNGGQAVLNYSEEILESRLLRDRYADRIEVLNKVKKLSMLPDDIHVTVEMAASYYEVEKYVIDRIIQRHREELTSDGIKTLRDENLREYKKFIGEHNVHLSAKSNLTLIPRRAILRIGMILRDSEVAKTVRSYLLNVEEQASPVQRQQAVATAENLENLRLERLKLAMILLPSIENDEYIDPNWTARKKQLLFAELLGERETTAVGVNIADFLREKGVRPTDSNLISFGKSVAQTYRKIHGEEPKKIAKQLKTGERLVNYYTNDDLDILEISFTQWNKKDAIKIVS